MPGELLTVLRCAERAMVSAPSPARVSGSLAEWAEVVGAAQRVINTATAVQDEAIVALAAIEPEELDDGTVVESHRAAGHVALDAPAIVSGALSVSAVHAEHRVRSAVRLAADGPTGTSSETGLGALHVAMRVGDLDAYRASVVAEELEGAPPEVAAAVIATLGEHLRLDAAPQLRRRCRTVLSRVSPDLVRQRAERARERCGLRRWATQPGVDAWEGTFPSEDAARAWAAIDARAQHLVADGTVERIDRARAQALVDLVTGSATIEAVVTLTVPARETTAPTPAGATSKGGTARRIEHRDVSVDAAGPPRPPDDLVEVSMGARGERVLVARAFLEAVIDGGDTRVVNRTCHATTGALLDHTISTAYRPPRQLAATVRKRDGRCRFPGCHVAARFCDLDHVRPWPSGPTADTNLICLCRRHHRVKQRPGWTVRLDPDAVCTWTEPTGRSRTTHPVDALRTLVLRAPPGVSAGCTAAALETVMSRDRARCVAPDVHSAIEFRLEHQLAALTMSDHVRAAELRHVRAATTGERLRVDRNDLRSRHRGRRERFLLAHDWARSQHPRHRTSPSPCRRRHDAPDDDPPF